MEGHIVNKWCRGDSELAWADPPLRVAIRINLVTFAKAFVKFCQYSESLVCTVIYFPNSACQRVLGDREAESKTGSWGDSGWRRPGKDLVGVARVKFLESEPKEQLRRWLFSFASSLWA